MQNEKSVLTYFSGKSMTLENPFSSYFFVPDFVRQFIRGLRQAAT